MKNREPQPQLLALDALLERFGGDWNFLRNLAGIFRDECLDLIDQLRESRGNFSRDEIRATAHALKGAAANLSAPELQEEAQGLEDAAQSADIEGIPARIDACLKAWARLSPLLNRIEKSPSREDL